MSRFLHGHLLIASPYLSDRNFFRSVVLIVSHDEEHAFGLLLNRPGHDTLAAAWQRLSGEECDRNERLRYGGPLEGPLMLLHGEPTLADTELVPEVAISTTEQAVIETVEAGVDPLVPITGYSGWGPGQLEKELEVGGWMTWPATAEVVFAKPEEMWSIASAQVSETIMPHLSNRHTPSDPRMN